MTPTTTPSYVRMAALLAPGSELGEEAAVDVRGSRAGMGADLLELDGEQSLRGFDFGSGCGSPP